MNQSTKEIAKLKQLLSFDRKLFGRLSQDLTRLPRVPVVIDYLAQSPKRKNPIYNKIIEQIDLFSEENGNFTGWKRKNILESGPGTDFEYELNKLGLKRQYRMLSAIEDLIF